MTRSSPTTAFSSSSSTSTAPTPLPQTYHYIRFAISPPLSSPDNGGGGGGGGGSDGLQIRHAFQEALTQSFGASLSHTYLDILWVATSGDECIVRASSQSDAASIMAAVAVASGNPLRFSALKDSPFLPSVSGESRKII